MLGTALALASRGLHIFPCRPRDKRPATEHGCLDATRDADTIRAWWRDNENYNVAIATGSVSGVFVIDIDNDSDIFEDDAEAAFAKLGDLPPTVEAITARGRHLYFKMPDADVRNSASKIAPGIDVRGTGGFVLCPPSRHPTGKRYTWSVDGAAAFADAPAWLLEKLSDRPNSTKATSAAEWQQLADGVAEGSRNATLTKLCGHLLRHYVSPDLTLQLLQSWNLTHCRPPLPETEVACLLQSIGNKEVRRRGK